MSSLLTNLDDVKQYLRLDRANRQVSSITKANPAVVTCTSLSSGPKGHGLWPGAQVELSGVLGMTQINGITLTASIIDSTSFSCVGTNSSAYGTYTGGGYFHPDDLLLDRLIRSASGFIENWVGREDFFSEGDYSEIYDGNGTKRMFLPNYPVTEVTSVVVNGVSIPLATSSTSFGFTWDKWSVYLQGYYFMRGLQNVSIDYTAGYSTVPDSVAQTCILLVGKKYRQIDRIGLKSKTVEKETLTFSDTDMRGEIVDILSNYKKVIPV